MSCDYDDKELLADALRYRWLISTNLGVFMQVGGRVEAGVSKADIDSAIDAAMHLSEEQTCR